VNTQRRIETNEQSRQRHDNHNFSASPSLDRARRSVGKGGMARTHGNATKESRRKLVKPTFRVTSRRDFTHYLSEQPEMSSHDEGIKKRPKRWKETTYDENKNHQQNPFSETSVSSIAEAYSRQQPGTGIIKDLGLQVS
jgi:hypothetical protein